MLLSPEVSLDCYEIFLFLPDGSPWHVSELGTSDTADTAKQSAELLRLFLVHGMFGSALRDRVPDADDRAALRALPELLEAWGADPAHVRVEAVRYGEVCHCIVEGDDESDLPDTTLMTEAVSVRAVRW